MEARCLTSGQTWSEMAARGLRKLCPDRTREETFVHGTDELQPFGTSTMLTFARSAT